MVPFPSSSSTRAMEQKSFLVVSHLVTQLTRVSQSIFNYETTFPFHFNLTSQQQQPSNKNLYTSAIYMQMYEEYCWRTISSFNQSSIVYNYYFKEYCCSTYEKLFSISHFVSITTLVTFTVLSYDST